MTPQRALALEAELRRRADVERSWYEHEAAKAFQEAADLVRDAAKEG